jgi:hypothetical protein
MNTSTFERTVRTCMRFLCYELKSKCLSSWSLNAKWKTSRKYTIFCKLLTEKCKFFEDIIAMAMNYIYEGINFTFIFSIIHFLYNSFIKKRVFIIRNLFFIKNKNICLNLILWPIIGTHLLYYLWKYLSMKISIFTKTQFN